MNLKNRNWDAKERDLDNEPVQYTTEKPSSNARDEAFRREVSRSIARIQNVTNQIRLRIELDARNSSMAVPDDIISFRSSGFDINVDNMPVEKQYSFRFEDSRYIIWKNVDDELVMKEID